MGEGENHGKSFPKILYGDVEEQGKGGAPRDHLNNKKERIGKINDRHNGSYKQQKSKAAHLRTYRQNISTVDYLNNKNVGLSNVPNRN